MKVDFLVELKAMDGKVFKERAGLDAVRTALLEAGVSSMMLDAAMGALRPFWGTADPKETAVTAQAVCMAALQAPEQTLTGSERVDRMRLVIKILDPEQFELSEKEKETILKCVEKAYASPVVYFRVHELFEDAARKTPA